jgi:hypothetical protein
MASPMMAATGTGPITTPTVIENILPGAANIMECDAILLNGFYTSSLYKTYIVTGIFKRFAALLHGNICPPR